MDSPHRGQCWRVFLCHSESTVEQQSSYHLTHWGRVTHICVDKLTIIASDNGLSPGRRQAIIWTNDWILLFGRLGTNFSEILIEIHAFSFRKMHLKMSSAKWRPFCLGLNVLMGCVMTFMWGDCGDRGLHELISFHQIARYLGDPWWYREP